ncbi:DUF1998 domain-containing protein [Bacillus sp. FJAT-50079]|uniref:DUF1998 domain-containing protein n=1 Tax=Bacillus sp. FJAT-50079 TaxID=2833577 RepID=UPI001BC8E40C|nr:DUF1998 domain-containing protein [Bacillus sp. FJAT-50079]MBS4208056.1 DUF1998 domain-containing protein [Bacillus sp. FJAT-50079]
MRNNKIAEIPLRRAELISPMGVGAICTNSEGVNMMTGALDKWYDMSEHVDVSEYVFQERRLEKILQVDELRLPPDYRSSYNQYATDKTNMENEIPMVRFPTWHYCNHCRIMTKESFANLENKISCSHCKGKNARMVQVPLVVVCAKGHIDDFPWVEWVHRSTSPNCKGPLKLVSTGGATLSTMQVQCTRCEDKKRSLQGVTSGYDKDRSILFSHLDSQGEKYICTGRKHWFGTDESSYEFCGEMPFALLKSSTNVYFPKVISALFLPGDRKEELMNVIDILLRDDVNGEIEYLQSLGLPLGKVADGLKARFRDKFDQIDCENIHSALKMLEQENHENDEVEYKSIEVQIKKQEHDVLIEELQGSEHLKIINEYDASKEKSLLQSMGITKINLVPTLRDTRVLYGFDRLVSNSVLNEESINHGKQLLFHYPERQNKSWLPGYKVFGEGIYIEFDHELLNIWEEKVIVSERFQKMAERIRKAKGDRLMLQSEISPRFVMLHTLAHLLIQELVFECGYSTSALRERMYVSTDPDYIMNGFLIYTASGDSEGTMGGLVRLGKKDKLEVLLRKVIEKASWCSSDPVCNEIGLASGQGVHHLNVAACHNCSYIPETSCEEFNRFLDRGLINIYSEENQGFFSMLKEEI